MSPEYDGIDEATAPRHAAVRRRVDRVAALLDDALRVPGTSIRVGLDPVIGLVPGVGDLVGGLLSAYIVIEAARAGAPTSVLVRMLGNLGIDSLVGSVPVAGDAFDVAWRANRRNVDLLRKHLDAPAPTKRASVFLVALTAIGALAIAAAGIALTILLVRWLTNPR